MILGADETPGGLGELRKPKPRGGEEGLGVRKPTGPWEVDLVGEGEADGDMDARGSIFNGFLAGAGVLDFVIIEEMSSEGLRSVVFNGADAGADGLTLV